MCCLPKYFLLLKPFLLYCTLLCEVGAGILQTLILRFFLARRTVEGSWKRRESKREKRDMNYTYYISCWQRLQVTVLSLVHLLWVSDSFHTSWLDSKSLVPGSAPFSKAWVHLYSQLLGFDKPDSSHASSKTWDGGCFLHFPSMFLAISFLFVVL